MVVGQAGVLANEGPGEELLDRPAPELALSRWANSEPLALADLEGKVVLLRWWTAPGCPFCSATAPSLNTLHQRYADRGLVIIGLYHHKSSAPLDPEQVEGYAESFGFQFPLAIDEGWENLRRWWLDTGERRWTSVSFLLDREGIVRWVHPGGEYPPDSDDYAELEERVKALLDEGDETSGAGNSLDVTSDAGNSLDVETIQHILGRDGLSQDGQYKVTVPQNDLDVTVDGFRIVPPMGLGSWVAFTPAAEGAVIMGDVVVREDEIGPVQQVLVDNGLTVTGLHNHFVRDEPSVMYMHVGGEGEEEALAVAVKAVFDRVAELRGADPASAQSETVPNTLGTDEIARILGHAGKLSLGVYKVTIGRPDVSLRAHGVPVTSFMGFNTWAAWQGTPERAAVAGDFAMLAHEVAPVIRALVEHGIEVVAVHNHMVHEEPRIFFLHYWGVGPAAELAQGLKAALDRVGSGR